MVVEVISEGLDVGYAFFSALRGKVAREKYLEMLAVVWSREQNKGIYQMLHSRPRLLLSLLG